MEEKNRLYLLFDAEGYYFLTPLSWVQNVADGHVDSGDTAKIKDYVIHLEQNDRCFLFRADHVWEVREVPQETLHILAAPVINDRNRYLREAVLLETADKGSILAYTLNLEYLVENEDLWNI